MRAIHRLLAEFVADLFKSRRRLEARTSFSVISSNMDASRVFGCGVASMGFSFTIAGTRSRQ